MDTELYFDIKNSQWPIIYRKEYNVKFMGLEKLHPFDSGKWGNIFMFLKEDGLINEETIVNPNEAKIEDLLMVHSTQYLNSLNCSYNVACIAEIIPLCVVPNCLIQAGYLKPMRYQVGGSILAGKLALERGFAINIGGGFHHCSAFKGGGFCPYADITLLITFLFKHYADQIKSVMIVDLDAHQGNGHENDFRNNKYVYIFDMYNKRIYPNDRLAKEAITRRVELESFTGDDEYLHKLTLHLDKALNEYPPNIVVYNAGTDILEGDGLGNLSITAEGIIKRDELVFKKVHAKNIPIVMLTSGGYLKKTARIIADSILNLKQKELIFGPTK